MDRQYQAIARQEAGHEALRVVAEHGPSLGENILKGYFIGFALALIAVGGRAAAEDAFREVVGSLPPALARKPTLAVSNV
jgi:hypothetical protein